MLLKNCNIFILFYLIILSISVIGQVLDHGSNSPDSVIGTEVIVKFIGAQNSETTILSDTFSVKVGGDPTEYTTREMVKLFPFIYLLD